MAQVSDVFQLALDSVPAEELKSEANQSLRNLHKGMEMTRDELHKVFKQFGVEPMDVRCGVSEGWDCGILWFRHIQFASQNVGAPISCLVAAVLNPWRCPEMVSLSGAT